MVTLKSDGGCFVCGEKNSAGLHVKFDVNSKKKTIEAEHFFSETYQGYDGIVHGGILSLLLDEAMVKLAFAVGVPAVTGEITVRFPSPLRPGERVWVQGRIIREDRRIVLTEARAEKEDGTIVAEAHARLFRKKDVPSDVR